MDVRGTMPLTIGRIRLFAALGVAGTALWALAPYATGYVSTQAVVNAPLNTVLSPLRGRIVRPSLAAGSGIAPGMPLVAIAAQENDRRHMTELRARQDQLDSTLAAIDREAARLGEVRARLEGRLHEYRARMVDRFAMLKRETEAELAAARAELLQRSAMLDRTERLTLRGHASEAQAEAEEAGHAAALAEVARLSAFRDRIGIEASAADAGLFIQDGWSDAPYSQQRLDEIDLRLAALDADRRRAAGERTTLAAQIAAEEQLISTRESFQPAAPSAGVIWRQSGAVGETVVPGDVLVQLVDCSARFVEVALPERHFGVIVPGALATIQLKGGGAPVTARVSAILGAGAKFDHPRLAASVPEGKPGQLRALVDLGGAALDDEPGAFCHVGRTAEVRFPSGGAGGLADQARAAGVRVLGTIAGLFGSRAAAARGPDAGSAATAGAAVAVSGSFHSAR